jgi:hypothetical protein
MIETAIEGMLNALKKIDQDPACEPGRVVSINVFEFFKTHGDFFATRGRGFALDETLYPDERSQDGPRVQRVKRSTATWYLPCPTSKNYWWYADAFGKGL